MQRTQLFVVASVVLLLAASPVAGAVADRAPDAAGTDDPSTNAVDRADASAAVQQQQQQDNVTGNPGIDLSAPDTDFVPGAQTALQVVVLNDGNVTDGSLSNPQLEQQVTTARALRVSVGEHEAPLTVTTNERAVARLPDGSSAPVEFRMEVDRSAQPGTYQLPINASYNYTASVDPATSEYNRTSTTRNFTVNVTIEEAAQFRVTDVESTARIGATGTVDVTMRNTGTAVARNASVALTSRNADLTFGASSSSTRYVGGAWAPGETRTVSYRVSAAQSASQQQYAFGATVSYEDEDSAPMESDSLSLGVTPAREQTFTVVDSASDVAVDDDGPVTVTVRNDGPIDVRDASVSVTSGSPALTFGGSTTASEYVGAWAANETREIAVEATATPQAESRTYSLQASVTYEDGEGDPGESGTLQFGVRPDPEVEYEFDASNLSSTLRVGEEGTLSGTITNVGDTRADSVVVVFESESQSVSPLEREYAVGNLRVNQSKEFAFDVEVSEAGEAGPKQFTLRPTYRNADDERREAESFDTRLRVRQQRDAFDVSVGNGTVERGGGRVLEVTVTNVGDDPVSDVSAAMFADDPISVDDSEAYADEIPAGESETLVFEVSAGSGALTKSYPVEMDFQYDDADGDTTLSSGYTVAVDVTEPEDGGGGLPVPVIVGALVVLVALVVGYLWYDR
ncbi:COG1361 S-layer family protein [Halosimplex litoreum]|uniref:COG1361 S-layer family protein n=1 Tax=Halosimplex litoreum TaxID=1198301 RepID=A0A7T3KVS5_9EURY|nr:COG1361 S-layer family protein [Halosimplex litoreum]QPV63444.1 COG1361 S-layer family protein [Halosimplex litoreum]